MLAPYLLVIIMRYTKLRRYLGASKKLRRFYITIILAAKDVGERQTILRKHIIFYYK